MKESLDIVEDSDKNFERVGEQFIKAKEACDVIEDLTDLLEGEKVN